MKDKKEDHKILISLVQARTVIGIDIGGSSVNVAQAALYQGKPTIIKAVIENIEVMGGQDRIAATTQALKNALANFDTKNADVICTLPNQKTIFDYITLPPMVDSEIAEAVKIEINNSPQFSMEDPVFDFQVAGRLLDKGVEKINVRVAVIAKSTVDNILSFFKPLNQNTELAAVRKAFQVHDFMGLNIVKFIPISIALENVIKKTKSKIQETIVVLEISSMSAELNIFRDGNLEFSRKINVAGFDFTRSLTSALSTKMGKIELTLHEAEWVKKEFGIPSASEDYLIKDKITANQAIAFLRPKLEQLIKEITRSFDFYYDKNRTGKLDRLILIGGGTMLKRLPEFLNAELGIPVGSANSLQDINFLDDSILGNLQDKHRMTLAIGAALSDPKGINLLPETFRDANKKFVQKMIMGLLLTALVFFSTVIYIVFLVESSVIGMQTSKIESEYTDMRTHLGDIKDKLKFQYISNHRLDLGGVLRELGYLPENVYLSDLSFKKGEFILSGIVLGQPRDARAALKPLLEELKKTSLRNVRISELRRDSSNSERTRFSMEGQEVSGSVK